jgi:hypothetical protein
MARRKPRAQRRLIWLNRIEWIAFWSSLVAGAVVIWLFVSFVA